MARILEVKSYSDPLFTYVHRFTQVRKEDMLQLLPFLEIRSFEKKEMVLVPGEIDNYLNIVMKGVVRKYISLPNKDVTMQLATEGHFIHSELSFNTRAPSELALQAVEAAIMVRISYQQLEAVLQLFPWAEMMGRMLVAKLAAGREGRIYNMRMRTPRERFRYYIEKHPHMLQRVPQHVLASYLNINPQTFSRLKGKLRNKAL